MGFDEVVILICSGLWLLYAAQLVRVPLRRSWQALVIALGATAATIAGHFLLERGSGALAGALVVLFLLTPALSTQGASRALKLGRIGRARLLAAVAYLLRPTAGQRVFRRGVEIAHRLGRGERVDIAASVHRLGTLSPIERAVHTAAFLSWTNEFSAIAVALSDARARRAAMRAGMGASVVTAIGETAGPRAICGIHRELCDSGALARRLSEAAWALIAIAAYLGEVELVRRHAAEHAADASPQRVAFFLATAEQRAGRPERAARIIAQALAVPRTGKSARARLQHRLEHPLEPSPRGEPFDAVRADVAQRLETLRTLAPLRMGLTRPAPLTLAIGASLGGAFAWQLRQPNFGEAIERLGLVRPFSEEPDVYRLLSYAWVHADAVHLLVNLIGLLVFGRFVERHFGLLRYLAIYLGGALAGGAGYLAWAIAPGVAVGASGAVFALFGATVARVALDRAVRASSHGRRELALLGSIAVLQLVIDALWAQSSGAAHAGGLAAGLLLGALLRPPPLAAVTEPG